MKNMASWLITIFIVMFWGFRLIIAFLTSMGEESSLSPNNITAEIIVLFISLFSILLIIKRKPIGGIIYAVTYGFYFGIDALSALSTIISSKDVSVLYSDEGIKIFIALVAMILAISVVLDLVLNKNRNNENDNKSTHWFYKNKKYERKLDKRADKNQYRL